MKVQYIEIVTPDVDSICNIYADIYNVQFGEVDFNLGGARIASLSNGGVIGIRAPLRETEEPVVRHYTLVEDIQSAVDAAEKCGAVVAVPPMELLGHGMCAIVIQSGVELGFWQL
ncbi:hydroxylase [Vibrio parahaemolyticus]|uniref:VOC family protein n=1 Tax=Vibrio parahaemolyticus TaxID=670 RepID=UPI00193F4423|nr:hydroxylase [Vibrio parahaemolyticus]MBM4855676.1 hydroxylase [Vibrio parahaemolyticus]WMN97251.1 hydroxylase [Vibrio parahaemolyticus]